MGLKAAPKSWRDTPWARLRTVEGKGGEVPVWLEALESPSGSRSALRALHSAILSPPRVAPAAGPVLSALVEIASRPDVGERALLLRLASDVLSLGLRAYRSVSLPFAEPVPAILYADDGGAALVHAAEGVTTTVCALLESDEPSVRAGAAVVLSDSKPTEALVTALARALVDEQVGDVAITLTLAASRVAAIAPHLARPLRDALPRVGAASRATVVVRGAAALAAAYLGSEERLEHDAVVELFRHLASAASRAMVTRKDSPPDFWASAWESRHLPWVFAGREGRADLLALHLACLTEEGRRLAIEACESLGSGDAGELHPEVMLGWAELLIGHAWPGGTRGRTYDADYAPAQLTETQRATLVALSPASSSLTLPPLGRVPIDARSRRRWLGLAGPSVLERTVSVDGVRASVADAAISARRAGAATFVTRLREVLIGLSPIEWISLWIELSARAYGIPYAFDGGDMAPDLALAAQEEIREVVTRYAREVGESRDALFQSLVGPAALHAGLHSLEADSAPPEHWDPLFRIELAVPATQAYLQRLPEPRRTTLLRERLDHLRVSPDTRSDVLRRALALLDQAPGAAASYFGQCLDGRRWVEGAVTRDIWERVEELRARHPAIEDALARHR